MQRLYHVLVESQRDQVKKILTYGLRSEAIPTCNLIKIVLKISHLNVNEGETYFSTILLWYLHFNQMQVYIHSYTPFNFFSLSLSLSL